MSLRAILQSEGAETPIEIGLTLMYGILVMTLLVMVAGPVVDGTISIISGVNIPLSTWGQTMMSNLPLRYASWVFYIPPFFILLIMAWGIKRVAKKHRYTTQEQYMDGSEYE